MDRGSACERARYWAALAPDGVLSQLEQRLLDAHVRHCSDCSSFTVDVAGLADTLRAAPPERLRFALRFRAPARRRVPRLSYSTAGAGIAATVAVAVAAVVPLRGEADRPAPIARPAIVIDATSVEGDGDRRQFLRQLRDYRNAQVANESDLATDRKPGFLAG